MIFPQPKHKRWQSEKYLNYIRKQPCLINDCPNAVPHHVRIYNNAGTSRKPSDYWTLPLCVNHHDEHDHLGRDSFWEKYSINIFYHLFKTVSGYLKQ